MVYIDLHITFFSKDSIVLEKYIFNPLDCSNQDSELICDQSKELK